MHYFTGYDEKPQWSVDHVQEVANNCNIQKYNAKRYVMKDSSY